MRSWDVATGNQLQRFPSFTLPVLSLELGDGFLFAGGSDMKIRCFSLPGFKQLRTYSRHTQVDPHPLSSSSSQLTPHESLGGVVPSLEGAEG